MLRDIAGFCKEYLSVLVGGDERTMKSRSKLMEVRKALNIGTMPVFVQMVHRHFEKENPKASEEWGSSFGGTSTYEAPVDLLKLTVSDPALVRDVEGVEFTYGKRA